MIFTLLFDFERNQICNFYSDIKFVVNVVDVNN